MEVATLLVVLMLFALTAGYIWVRARLVPVPVPVCTRTDGRRRRRPNPRFAR